MGDLRHHIVEALDVLDVEGREDVDAVAQQLLDVEIALRMAAARNVGVGELVNQSELGAAREKGVKIHFLERAPLILEAAAGDDFETFDQRLGLLPPMGLDRADDHIDTALGARACLLQHLIGLAHAGGSAHEDLQLARAALFAAGGFEQGLRRWALVLIATLLCHRAPEKGGFIFPLRCRAPD